MAGSRSPAAPVMPGSEWGPAEATAPPVPAPPGSSLVRSLPTQGQPSAAPAPSPSASAQEWPADAGTTLVLVEDHRAPLVTVMLEFAAGTWSPWFVDNHAEEAFELQLDDAAGSLRRRADALGLAISLRAGALSSTLSFSCLKKDLKAALALAGDLLANP